MLSRIRSAFKPKIATVEDWANHNSKKCTADDLIAGAVVASFAKHYKQWKFEGEFNQRHSNPSGFQPTKLSFKVPTKKHVEIVFLFKEADLGDAYSTIYRYTVIGCEVNGVRVTDAAFKYIYTNWNNLVVQMKHAEEVAAKAKADMEDNEKKWNLAENLLGMKRDGLGRLMPVKTVEAAE
jgi:hypothetical protein